MNVVYANRALGILKVFLEKNINTVETWFLPSTCCFSVPFLFKTLKQNIVYYDFGFDVKQLISLAEANNQKLGLLLVDYYGIPWSDRDLKLLRSKFSLIVHDACLSDISFDVQPNVGFDLKIYSTGKGKSVDLNGGAIGYSNLPIELESNDIDALNTRYQFLDSYWKKVIANEQLFTDDIIFQEWIDTSKNKVQRNYRVNAESKQKKLMLHRSNIINIYDSGLPNNFKNFPIGDWRYSFLVDKPYVLLKELKESGLFASNHYASVAKYLNSNLFLPNSEMIEKHIINLFTDFNISTEQAILTTKLISRLFRENKITPLETKFELDYAY